MLPYRRYSVTIDELIIVLIMQVQVIYILTPPTRYRGRAA